MLERLLIRNFQNHEKLAIDFDPKITTIVGRSDSGKSAVIRALRWLATNQPRGASFTRHGEESVAVKLIADGRTITRGRKKDSNTYTLDEAEFVAFGSNVPDPIKDFLRLEEDLNFQGQHAGPYWLDLPPGQVSAKLNEIVDLAIIDSTISHSKSRLQQHKQKIEIVRSQFKEQKKKVEELKWVEEADNDLSAIESIDEQLGDLLKKATALDEAIKAYFTARVSLDAKRDQLEDLRQVGKAGAEAKKLDDQTTALIGIKQQITAAARTVRFKELSFQEVEVTYLYLGNQAAAITDLNERITRGNKLHETVRFKELDFSPVEGLMIGNLERDQRITKLRSQIAKAQFWKDSAAKAVPVDDVGEIATRLESLSKKLQNLTDVIKAAGDLNTKITLAQIKVSKKETEIKVLSGGMCPVCGGPL